MDFGTYCIYMNKSIECYRGVNFSLSLHLYSYFVCASSKNYLQRHYSCGDPESFVRGGPTLTVVFFS